MNLLLTLVCFGLSLLGIYVFLNGLIKGKLVVGDVFPEIISKNKNILEYWVWMITIFSSALIMLVCAVVSFLFFD